MTKSTFLRIAVLMLLATALSAQDASLRFAWLSDTHVGSGTGAEDLRRAVRDINSMADVRFVLLSGDITEWGSTSQLHLAKSIVDSLRKPSYIIPGNHDTKWSESGTTAFPNIFGGDKFVFEAAGMRFIGMHQGPRMRMADGYWSPEDVRWLDSVLASLPDSRQRLVFVTHYPLDAGIANWYVVLDRLKKFNTQVCLVGHGHSNRKQSFEGVPGVMGRSNLRSRDAVGGFTVATLSNDTLWFAEKRHGEAVRKPWHFVVLGQHDWQGDTTRVLRPDFSVNGQFPDVQETWRIKTGFTIGSSAMEWKERCFVGDASGLFMAIATSNGKKLWEFRTGGPIYSTPTVIDNRVVVCSTDGSIYALEASNGKLLWRLDTGNPIVACPVAANGIVYVGSSDGTFRALRATTGAIVWRCDSIRDFVETRPVVYENLVLFGSWGEYFYALDTQDGHIVWRWKGDRAGTLLSPAACRPVVSHDAVFIVAPDRRMTALDVRTGEQLWRTSRHEVRETIGSSADGSLIFVRTMNDSLIGMPASRSLPQPVWAINAGFGYDISSAAIVERNGTLYYGTKNGVLLAVEASSGIIIWKHRVGVGLLNTVTPLSGGGVVVTDFDGTVALIRPKP